MATLEIISAVPSVSRALLTEGFSIDVTVKNTTGSTVGIAYLLFTIDGTSVTAQRTTFSVGGRKTVTVKAMFDGRAYPSAWREVMAGRRRANLYVRACDNDGSISEAYAVEGFEILDAYYAPRIGVFSAERTADEADTVRATIHISHAAGLSETQIGRMSVTLSAWDYADEYREIAIGCTLAEMAAGITYDIAETFETGKDYLLTLVFGDYSESTQLTDVVDRAFANLHLSGKSTGGACFGGFCKSQEGKPLLESHYPIRAYEGIDNFRSGVTEVVTVRQNYAEVPVLFPTPFREDSTPAVVVCMDKEAQDSDRYMALLSAFVVSGSVTDKGFTVRVCSNSSNSYAVGVRWLAYGAV